MHPRYSCVICENGEEQHTAYSLSRHVRCQHRIELSEYHWRYLLKLDEHPRCAWRSCSNVVKYWGLADGFARYCCRSCISADTMSKTVTNLHKDKEFRKRTSERSRKNMSATCERMWSDPEFRERHAKRAAVSGSATLARIAKESMKYRFEHEGRTYYEDILYRALEPLGINFLFGDRRFMNGNTGYVLDFSFPESRLNVELDGWSHNDTKDLDKARDEHLRSHGWTVLRIRNEELMENLEEIVKRIQEMCQTQVHNVCT